MRFEPFEDNVFVVLDKGETTLASGIVLPNALLTYGGKLLSGTVIKAGPGTEQYPVDVSVGDKVVFSWDRGEVVVVGDDIAPDSAPDFEAGTEFRVLRSCEIEMVVG